MDYEVYEPAEDSELLKRNIKNFAKSKIVLDVGTGSGIQAVESAKYARKVYAVDINPEAIEYCKKVHENENIEFIESDLFTNIQDLKFDLITFNPPYLPQDEGIVDPALYGGKKGWEIYEKFFSQVQKHLRDDDSKILILFSSLTNKDKVEEIIKSYAFDFKEEDKTHVFFEDLFVYSVSKSDLLKTLEENKVKEVSYLAKGKRGIVFTGIQKLKKVAIKSKNPDSTAIGRMKNESTMLKRLNDFGIGPKFLFSGENYLAYVFVEGMFFPDFLEKESKENILVVLKRVFSQLKKMDELGINKEEMHRPLKHIIVTENFDPVMIDFERAHFTEKPQNITQFSKFMSSGGVQEIIAKKGLKYVMKDVIDLTKKYRAKEIDADKVIDYFLQK